MVATAQYVMVATQPNDFVEPSSYNDACGDNRKYIYNSINKTHSSHGKNRDYGQHGGGDPSSMQASASPGKPHPIPWK